MIVWLPHLISEFYFAYKVFETLWAANVRITLMQLTSTISSYEFGHQPEVNNPQMPIIFADKGYS